MGTPILLTKLKREKDKLYYVGTSAEGNLVLFETQGKTAKKAFQDAIAKIQKDLKKYKNGK